MAPGQVLPHRWRSRTLRSNRVLGFSRCYDSAGMSPRSSWRRIAQPGMYGPLTRSNVGIAQDVGFEFQIVQAVSDHVADADDTGELTVAQHRHMAHAMPRHQVHHAIDTLVGRYG